jgi:nucleoside-diphosphate-sugar epimerase
MNILITGGTGFLGRYLVEMLASQYEVVYLLSRSTSHNKFSHLPNVKYIAGDITHLDVLIMEEDERKDFLESIDVVLHAAALYELSASHANSFLQNVVGTQNILHLVSLMPNVKAFYYVSTIAVGDQSTFFLDENQLPKRDKFSDAYSETKYLAEKIIRNNVSSKYVTRIFRPGIIIGDSKTFIMPKVDGPYYFIEAYKKYAMILKHLPFVPLSFNPEAVMPIIPVDHCARFMALLMKRETYKGEMKTYHLVSSEIPTLREFLQDMNEMFEIKTTYIPVPANKAHNSILKTLGIPKEVLPFMFSRLSYDKTSTLEDLPEIKESVYSSFKNILFRKS